MIQSFAYKKLIPGELKDANRDKKVSIVVELSNQKEDFKVIIALKSLENTQCLQTLVKKLKNSASFSCTYQQILYENEYSWG